MIHFIRVVLLLFVSLSVHALEVSVSAEAFKSEEKTYIETYLRVLGHSVTFEKQVDQSLKQASIEFTIIIKDGETIVSCEKYVLNSPMVSKAKDFLDVKRFAVPSGTYTLNITAVDLKKVENKLELEKKINVQAFDQDLNLSDVQLFGKVEQSNANNPLAKNGVYMEPLNYGVVTEDIKVLNIYTEAYLSENVDGVYFVKYAIHEAYNTTTGEEVMKKVQKMGVERLQPLLLQLPVDKLPSGNYRVEVSVMDKKKNVVDAKYVDFLRSNEAYDLEYWSSYNKVDENSFVSKMSMGELEYALRAVDPIVREPKRNILNYMIHDAPLQSKRKFLFSIWKEKEPENTQHHYEQYMVFAKAVDIEYNSNVGYGFETDRGYTFLRYGKPNNTLAIDQEPDSYPYEIWYYNYIEESNQTNVRFLFYNKSLVHNDYSLLHSTCRLERQNPQWEIELYRKGLDTPLQSTIDARTAGDGWDRMAKKYFNEF